MATTWSAAGVNAVKAVCTTANEAASVLTDATQGFSLDDAHGIVITVEADSTRTLSGTGAIAPYMWDPAAAAWVPFTFPTGAPSMNITESAVRRAMRVIPRLYLVKRGRIAFLPSSLGVSAGGATIYIAGGR